MKKYIISLLIILIIFSFNAQSKDVNSIIEKNLNARGGKAALLNITSNESKVVMNAMSMEIPMTIFSKKPNKARIELNVMGQNIIQVFDGVKVAVSQNGQVTVLEGEMAEKTIEQMKSQSNSYNNPLINYTEKGINIEYIGSESIDGDECDILKLTDKDKKVTKLFISAKTGLDIKLSMKQEIQDSEKEIDIFFEDNKKVNDILVPFKMTIKADGEIFATMQFEYIKFNINFDDSLFKLEEKK